MGTNISITTQDDANTAPTSVFFLFVVIAAIEVALPPRNPPPQVANLLGFIDVSAHLITVEEESRMDVVSPVFTLFNTEDVTSLKVEDRIALTLSNQPIQVVEYVLNT